MDVASSRFHQHERRGTEAADEDETVMRVMRDELRLDDVVPDRRPVVINGHRDNVMKRKTLRHCDDGQVSVSESFTESETSEAGTQSL